MHRNRSNGSLCRSPKRSRKRQTQLQQGLAAEIAQADDEGGPECPSVGLGDGHAHVGDGDVGILVRI